MPEETTYTQEQVDEKVEKAVNKAVEKTTKGLKSKNAELLGKVTTLQDAVKKFDGVNLEELTELKEKVENDEVLKLMADGKSQEALNKYTERLTVKHETETEKLKDTIKKGEESNKKNQELVNSLLIDGGAKAEFLKAKGLTTATDDIALRARAIWRVEDGALVARDEKNEMIKGEDGALTMKEWAEGLKKKAPHLFPASESGGGTGGEGGTGNSIDDQILEAAEKEDFALIRKLKEKKKKGAR